MSYVIGLTGGIGSGKTTVANLFLKYGIEVIDTDDIARELTSTNGEAIPLIREVFGQAVIASDGSLDRVAMRELVFSSPQEKARLEAILHPMIRKRSQEQCLSAKSAYVLLVVPLLLESGHYKGLIKRVVVVDCAEEVQVSRVMKRNGLTADAVRSIMRTQASREERQMIANDVIHNDGNEGELLHQVEALHHKYLTLASQS